MSQTPATNPENPDKDLEPDDRYAFNLPRGSVRGALVLMIMVPFWVMLAWPTRLAPMPFYVYFLLVWVFVFIASPFWSISSDEGSTDEPAPFHLPKYTFHILIFVVTVGLLGWRIYDPGVADLLDRLTPGGTGAEEAGARAEQMSELPWLLMSMGIGFASGWGLARLLGKWRDVYWFQDIQASVSLIAMLLLAALTLIHVINATLLKEIPTHLLQYILIGLVAWYFGART
jgi:hypothetical protein